MARDGLAVRAEVAGAVASFVDGAQMNVAARCRELGISKTFYKYVTHFQADGVPGLFPRPRQPCGHSGSGPRRAQGVGVCRYGAPAERRCGTGHRGGGHCPARVSVRIVGARVRSQPPPERSNLPHAFAAWIKSEVPIGDTPCACSWSVGLSGLRRPGSLHWLWPWPMSKPLRAGIDRALPRTES